MFSPHKSGAPIFADRRRNDEDWQKAFADQGVISGKGFCRSAPGAHLPTSRKARDVGHPAVGGFDNSGNPLATKCGYWANTVVLITWDDWGGWYDHVLPWNCNNTGVCSGYTGGQNGGGSEYVYGFRVPLLVVSAYAKKGYISGICGPGQQHICPNEQQQYIHDFGSILNFIEYAFGNNQQPMHFPGFPPQSGISPSYFYADVFAPDGHVVYPPEPVLARRLLRLYAVPTYV